MLDLSKIASIVMLHQDLDIRTTCQNCTNGHLKDVIFGARDAACKEIIDQLKEPQYPLKLPIQALGQLG